MVLQLPTESLKLALGESRYLGTNPVPPSLLTCSVVTASQRSVLTKLLYCYFTASIVTPLL